MRSHFRLIIFLLAVCLLPIVLTAAPRKGHLVALGRVHTVPYSKVGDPAGALPDEDSLKIRPLVVDGQIKEWTTGEVHSITDRTFVVRRVMRINDDLPGEDEPGTRGGKPRWVWQRGLWLMVERKTGHVTVLKLPDFNLAVSRVVWFRDYAAYCGVTASGKSLYAVVAQVAVRKPVLSRKLSSFNPENPSSCGEPQWQRKPLQIKFFPGDKSPVSFQFVAGSTVLVESTGDEPESDQTTKPGLQPEAGGSAVSKP
ncbi:MAG TPA: hypothetical protein VG844_13310 [Terracidiphilus sp.]|nr:hypothetical protein [Terracidiphilus sp.]